MTPERFQQIEPVVLFAVDGYQYNGKIFDRRSTIAELQEALPTLHTTVVVPYTAGESEPGEGRHKALPLRILLGDVNFRTLKRL